MGFSYLAMKPTAPLLALPCSGMKPPSPLRATKGHFWAISTLQRCRWFQWGAQRGVQRCRWFQWGAQCGAHRRWWFQSCPVIACCARNLSPCSAWCVREREKVRPASQKRAKNAVFRCAGRVFSRMSHWKPRAGRTISRKTCGTGHVGRTFSRKCRGRSAESPHGECAYARRQSLRPPLVSRGEISHAIPLKAFQVMNFDR